ncbi:phage repressor protein CI [Serratia proteamaculans]|uniref:Phage repressor protein CI n=1 Tax=Serratia proteamaculans TaxID=28151 RepID=A0ABS0TZX4_SERPR|nr:phage repressor protein CI [Serratia proteamaculans]MBI6183672.1 phage repressor protein CI [Serratia proteamaculans]
MDLVKGGRGAIERMVEAYGFSTRQALCEQLGVSKSTLATRYMRDSFPSDWVIQCTLETGVSLRWLITGEGIMYEDSKLLDLVQVPRQKLVDGRLFDSNLYMFDKAFLPEGLIDPVVILDGDSTYIADRQFDEIIDGAWVVDIEGKISIRDVIRIPGGKVRIEGGKFAFDCQLEDIKFIQRIRMSCTK